MATASRGANHLRGATSPYLLGHARDPIDWYPWGREAFERARRLDRPIFLSIGYSACHGCRAMALECFSDARVARRLNRDFVPVQVDREERGDIDALYLAAVRELGGETGWPLSVFLTPDGAPFWGGSYLPLHARDGRLGFLSLLASIADQWLRARRELLAKAQRVSEVLARGRERDGRGSLHGDILDRSLSDLGRSFDPLNGGFGGAPKFPRPTDLRLLLRHHLRARRTDALGMVTASLDAMARGGIHDQLAGGFHRYSTDERWIVPHFEKMLAENALLVPLYLEAAALTGRTDYAETARRTCEWALREMRTDEGGFASSLAADSPRTTGQQGGFYTWTPREVDAVLGAQRGARARDWYGVGQAGNFEDDRSVLCAQHPAEGVAAAFGLEPGTLLADMRLAREWLFLARERRPRPGRDDKQACGANALMASALAHSYQATGAVHHLAAARLVLRILLGAMRLPDGGLAATRCAGRNAGFALLADWAYTIQACVDLYECDFDRRWIAAALELSKGVDERFLDRRRGIFFDTAAEHEPLLARLTSPQDGALPSGSAVHVLNLLRLAELCGRKDLAERAGGALTAVAARINSWPAGFSQMLVAVDFLQAGPLEIAMAGDEADPELARMLARIRRCFRPQRVVALRRSQEDEPLIRLLAGRDSPDGRARAWVCRHWACREPVSTAGELAAQLG